MVIHRIRCDRLLCYGYPAVHNFPMVSASACCFHVNPGSLSFSQPIHAFWDREVPHHCISGDDILVVPGAINAVLDGLVILLVGKSHCPLKPRAFMVHA